MNTLCFVLVLFTTRIIYTKEESSLDQNKTASTSSTTSSPPPRPKDLHHGINLDKVELFKDDDELPSNTKDLTPGSNQSKPPIDSTRRDLSTNGATANAKGNQTSEKIYEDYDINDLQLDKYKIMVAPNKYKTINATNIRFLNQNTVNNSGGQQIGIKQFENKVSGQYLVLPNGTRISGNKAASNQNNPALVPGSTPRTDSNNSMTPIPWVISPACLQKNESKYLFSAIFNKKPTVHLLTVDNGTAPNNQTPNIVINNNSVTMSVGNETLRNESYDNFSNTTKSNVLTNSSNSVFVRTDNNTTPDNHGKLKIEDHVLKGLTHFTMTIQNNTNPQNHVTLSKVGDFISISGGITTHGNDKNQISQLGQILQHNIAPGTTAQQIQQPTVKLIPNLQANVSVKTPTVTITTQGTKKIDPISVLLLENSLLQTPLPGITLNKTQTTLLTKPQSTIHNILNSELGERSFFSPELKENFKRPTEKKTVGNLITQKETDVQSSDVLYELFKNITMTNVINEDLNRKLLNESQIHTQQNWQLIKGNTDILNALKNKNEQNTPPHVK